MKKFVAFTLAVFMVVAMTACGSNETAPAAQGSKDAAAQHLSSVHKVL